MFNLKAIVSVLSFVLMFSSIIMVIYLLFNGITKESFTTALIPFIIGMLFSLMTSKNK